MIRVKEPVCVAGAAGCHQLGSARERRRTARERPGSGADRRLRHIQRPYTVAGRIDKRQFGKVEHIR